MDSHLKGWIAAGDLKKGDKLVSKDGSIKVVEEVTVEKLNAPVKVYNLEVEGNHNYYVSDECVLVHNSCASGENTNNSEVEYESKASSKKLRDNMNAAGIENPDYPNAAHHIVAGSSPKAASAREVLKHFGIGINDANNGVFLPTSKGGSNGAYHPSLHTNDYYKKVNNLIKGAESKEDLIDILGQIAKLLSKGAF